MTAKEHAGSVDPGGSCCPACSNRAGIVSLYTLSGIPVQSTLLLDSETEALEFPTGDLELMWCPSCGFAFNSRFEPALVSYGKGYEDSQGASPAFTSFARELARGWIDRYGLKGKRLLEIGCGKGEFLQLMCEEGSCSGVGYDPAYVPGRTAVPEQVTFIARDFDADALPVETDFILCRHTLEHIGDVTAFLRLVRQACGDDQTIRLGFELPDFGRILHELAFWDIYYEHCSYFTAGSLARAFTKNGFDVLDVRLVFGDQYLIIEAKPTDGEGKADPVLADDLAPTARGVDRFKREGLDRIDEWRRAVMALEAAGMRIALWGSGSKAVGFLTTIGNMSPVHCVVDINPARAGRFMPGCPMPIIAPGELPSYRPDVVIVMNPVYRDEIAADIASMDLRPQLCTTEEPPHASISANAL